MTCKIVQEEGASKKACPSEDKVGMYCCSEKSTSTEKGIYRIHNCPQKNR
jgi:hypothetical protein